MFIDSHCHLTHEQYTSEADVEETITRAVNAGIERMYCTGGMLGHDEKVLVLCAKHPKTLRPVIGISPHDANRVTQEQKKDMFNLIEKNRKQLAGIGEIGLDFHHFKTQEEQAKQEALFREEIELARTLDLPIVIHSRKAEAKVLDILQEVKFSRFAMHCFMVKELCSRVVQQGGLVSLPTIKSKDKKYIMKHIGIENLLCETDSPYLWQQGRNEPANVKTVYEEISKAKEQNIEKTEEKIAENVEIFFQ
ncbi:MAG: TatD family hydrolase [Candidatus Micrarchaeota archaeon]|nr:TatD family hydrolase [Candidatus Micrarchaeota archaeon]